MTQDMDLFVRAIERIVNEDFELGRTKIAAKELWQRLAELEVEIPDKAEEILHGMGFVKNDDSGDYYSYFLIFGSARELK
jgi:hypothetical protein